MTECNLHTIVRLPNGVFNPYTGIKTNILFFTKGEPTTDVWFYEHPYPEGVKNYNKSKPMQFAEFQPEIDWWGNEADGFKARKETNQAWKRSVEYFEQRGFNLDDKNPFEAARKDLDPDDLLEDYRIAQDGIQNLRDQAIPRTPPLGVHHRTAQHHARFNNHTISVDYDMGIRRSLRNEPEVAISRSVPAISVCKHAGNHPAYC